MIDIWTAGIKKPGWKIQAIVAKLDVANIAHETLNQSTWKPVIEFSEADVKQRIVYVIQIRKATRNDRAEPGDPIDGRR